MIITPPAHLTRIYERLIDTYGEPENDPDYDPLGGLVGTILSQHTSDINSERAFGQLVATFPTHLSISRGHTQRWTGKYQSSSHPGRAFYADRATTRTRKLKAPRRVSFQ